MKEAARAAPIVAKLEAKLFNKDGVLVHDYGVVSEDASIPDPKPTTNPAIVKQLILLLACAISFHYCAPLALGLLIFGLVTNVGVNYEAAAFADTGPVVSALNYHDSGTGSTPAAITDTALVSPAGGPRVSGAQSSVTNIYQTTALISYSSNLIISEWGLFNASSGGTLWDRRVINPIVTASGDKIQFTYTCMFPSGGI